MVLSKKFRAPSSNHSSSSSNIHYPVEVWRKIVGYAVRLEGHESVELEDPFSPHSVGEEYPEIDPGLFDDRRSLGQVSSLLRTLVNEISSEYLVIFHPNDLERIIYVFEQSRPDMSGKRLGHRTKRIDIKIAGPYKAKKITALLRLTPNLLVFVHQGNRQMEELGRVDKKLMSGLMRYGRNVQRLDFDSMSEAPALFDIVDVSRYLPNIKTLRVLCLHSYPLDPDTISHIPTMHFNRLKTLSLRCIPDPLFRPDDYFVFWDPLLLLLGLNTKQLPALERLELGVYPQGDTAFLKTHGFKIRMLQVPTAQPGTHLPIDVVLRLCVGLESLVLVHGASGGDTPRLPDCHPTIKKIYVTPSIERVTLVPRHIFLNVVMKPLERLIESVEGMNLPSAEEFRVRNYGVYGQLDDHSEVLSMWRQGFASRGIEFVDQDGMPYHSGVESKWYATPIVT